MYVFMAVHVCSPWDQIHGLHDHRNHRMQPSRSCLKRFWVREWNLWSLRSLRSLWSRWRQMCLKNLRRSGVFFRRMMRMSDATSRCSQPQNALIFCHFWSSANTKALKPGRTITGNRQCRAHGLQNARISCGEVNVRSRAYPLNTSDLWRFWRTFLEFCCGAYVFRYQRLLRGFALLLFGSSGAIGNSCRVELVGCLPFPSPMGLSSGWKALRVQQG